MKILKDFLAPAYLGFALGMFAGLQWYDWQFWAIIVPFFVLAKITGFNQDEE